VGSSCFIRMSPTRTLGRQNSRPFLQLKTSNGERDFAIELFILSEDVDKVMVEESFNPFLSTVEYELQNRYLVSASTMCWSVKSKVFLPNPLCNLIDRKGFLDYCSLTELSYPCAKFGKPQ
jgi:hypothetical protein